MFSRTFLSVRCRVAAKSSLTVQNLTTHRSVHLACRNLGARLVRCHQTRVPVINATTIVRHLSVSTARLQDASAADSQASSGTDVVAEKSSVDELLSQIPEPPSPPVIQEVVEAIQTVGEPTFQSIGLGGWYPSGMIQQILELLHINAGLPWWACIAASTVFIRTITLPIVIRMQKYTARMNNVQPEMQLMQANIADARKMGDHMEVLRLTQNMFAFMKQHNIDPLRNGWLPFLQAPIFLSFYWGLRGMVNVPVESMKEGGLWWFNDLTVPDPYCLLPLLTSTTLFITLEMGADTLKISNMGMLKYVFRAIPIVMFPFIIKFEGAILCYWVSTNMFSLIQVSILRLPKVRTYFQIPELIKHDTKKLVIAKKDFVTGFKDSWTNMKLAREIGNRDMYDASVFQKAGKGPIPKTYKFDPTKQQVVNTVLARKKD